MSCLLLGKIVRGNNAIGLPMKVYATPCDTLQILQVKCIGCILWFQLHIDVYVQSDQLYSQYICRMKNTFFSIQVIFEEKALQIFS